MGFMLRLPVRADGHAVFGFTALWYCLLLLLYQKNAGL